MEMNKIKNMSVNSKNIMHPELKIDFQVLRKSVLVLRAVNHKLRHEMIRLIHREGKMTVTDLDGKFIYYSVDHERMDEISRLLEELVK